MKKRVEPSTKLHEEEASSRELFLGEKIADESSMILILDASEEFGAEFSYCVCAVKRHTFVHYSTAKVAGHALGLQDGFDLRIKVDPNSRIPQFGCRT